MLYVVATPIGNLKEITYYAVEILKKVDYILCEDKRTSRVLLDNYNIDVKTIAYHKFNETALLDSIVKDLTSEKDIALISDAGMPGISDPGAILINKLIQLNLPYTVISGPCALINAFILSGFPTPFTFIGFLPPTKNKATNILLKVKSYETSLIFYVPNHSLHENILLMNSVLGNRQAYIVREISKKFEEKTLINLADGYSGVEKGEFIIVIKGYSNETKPEPNILLKQYLDDGISKMTAIKMVAKELNLKKNDVYKLTL